MPIAAYHAGRLEPFEEAKPHISRYCEAREQALAANHVHLLGGAFEMLMAFETTEG
jgi:hypothetical protein